MQKTVMSGRKIYIKVSYITYDQNALFICLPACNADRYMKSAKKRKMHDRSSVLLSHYYTNMYIFRLIYKSF